MKNYNLMVLFLFVIFFLLLSFPIANANLPLHGMVIYVDPGHGGVDPGSVVSDVLEKDINLNISLYLKEELKKYGAVVYLTREGDYDLGAPTATYRKKSDFDHRIKLIHQSKATIYLSIHLNVLQDTRYFGPQVFYNQKDEKSKQLSEHIQQILNEELQSSREIKKIPNSTYMYSKLKIPGVLIECGFLSNSKERKLLKTTDYQKKIASSIAKAIQSFAF